MTNRLTIKEIFHGGGKLTAKGQIVSIGLIEEGLKKKFTIRILEETPHRLRCKVYRYFRLYGGPIIFPNHSLEVSLQIEPNQVIINYSKQWCVPGQSRSTRRIRFKRTSV